MYYEGKQCLVTGASGFIGSKVADALKWHGAIVTRYSFDVRDRERLNEHISHKTDYVFHFGSPSSNVLFGRNLRYCVDVTVNGFLNVSELCAKTDTKLIYPSTGLLSYENLYNDYAMTKKMLEQIHFNSNLNALGLRIFAGYGPNEAHKRDFASPVFLFTRDIFHDKQPVVFGNGEQRRDFIYIDDLANDILILAEEYEYGISNIGSGMTYSFNEIIEMINEVTDKTIKPIYVGKPNDYYDAIECDTSVLHRYCEPGAISLEEGIERICLTL